MADEEKLKKDAEDLGIDFDDDLLTPGSDALNDSYLPPQKPKEESDADDMTAQID